MRIRNHTGIVQGYNGVSLPPHTWLEVDPAAREAIDGYRLGLIDFQINGQDRLRQDTVHWRSPLSLADGYATAAEQLILALMRIGASIYVEPVWFKLDTGLDPITQQKLREPFPGFMETGICMATPSEFRMLPTKVRFGLTMYEASDPLEKYPEWKHDCDHADMLIVPSRYCKQVFEQFFRGPIHIVPLAVNPLYYTALRRHPKRTFTFVSYGTLSKRKSPLETIDCFQKAFPTEQDVRLVLKTRLSVCGYGKGPMPRIDDPRVEIIDVPRGGEDWTALELRDWLQQADCFVWLSKGEGFGMPPREALCTGLPLIYAHNTSMTDLDGYPVWTAKEEDSPLGGKWAIPDWDMAIDYMRYVYQSREDAYDLGERAALNYIAANHADTIARRLWEVLGQGKHLRQPVRNGDSLKRHHEFYQAIKEMVAGPVLALGKKTHEECQEMGISSKCVPWPGEGGMDLAQLGRFRKEYALVVSRGAFQDLHPQEVRLIVDWALEVAPIFFSVPTVHYPNRYSDQARLFWRKTWDDWLYGFSRQLRYYDKKKHLMVLIEGKANYQEMTHGMVTRDGIWRANEDVADD